MVKRMFLLLLCLVCPAWAGFRTAGPPRYLAGDEKNPLCTPQWSPDGELISVTTPHYAGIWLLRPDGSEMRRITDEPGAGFGLQWSPDGASILARVGRTEGHRRHNALKRFDIASRRDTLLTAFRTGIVGLPCWGSDGREVFASMNGSLQRIPSGLEPALLQRRADRPLWFLDGDRAMLLAPAAEKAAAVAALAGRRIFNLVQSADGGRVAFQILGGPLCVMRSDGTGLVELGAGEHPGFSPDGQHLVFMVTQDDGHTITGSDLYIIGADGTGRTKLTSTEGRSEMHPAWSPRGDAILYDLYETGEIWSLPVTQDESIEKRD